MKKLLLILALCFSLPSQANLLTLDVSSPELNIGEALSVTVSATNFDPFSTLGFEIEFDTDLFAFAPNSVGGDLANTGAFIFEVSAQTYGVAMSFIDFEDFTQPNFSAFTFNLTAIASGSTDFTLANIQSFMPIDSAALNASAQVNSVPAAGTFSIFLFTAFCLALRHRTRARLTS
ncbi:hypothetical protein Patl_2342 [Paraglaciecola sp. T6c]|uniref:hypothetical protein n=1 Tax=Pseudoalteromonas atlantica (strain T6c / ATCC BAA-1087) TaxID=3042615 RepID=UPI00005C7345|nr:hypothetical protein [Paraglaciecola sp. T6c]ABG40859.1 hypothetical protein Patl_2342 [Paraglaciecola sp. T6c]